MFRAALDDDVMELTLTFATGYSLPTYASYSSKRHMQCKVIPINMSKSYQVTTAPIYELDNSYDKMERKIAVMSRSDSSAECQAQDNMHVHVIEVVSNLIVCRKFENLQLVMPFPEDSRRFFSVPNC